MLRRILLGGVVLVFAASVAGAATTAHVARVVDGDTLVVDSGARVRLVQIDTPELGSGECYSRAAARALRRLAPEGSAVTLEGDAELDSVDRYGRLLRYVWSGTENVNLELVREGAATVWFYGRARGRYADQLIAAAREARTAGRGLWGACNATWNPYGPATTSPRTAAHPVARIAGAQCDPSYPDVCIPPPPPDLDCADITFRHFRVVGADPHRFDGDHNGIGCER